MISLDDRLKYYLGDTRWEHPPEDHKYGYDVPIYITRERYQREWSQIHPNTQYPLDVVRLLKYSDNLWINCGDATYHGPNWPVLIKVRTENSKGIIANLNKNRHFGDVFKHEDVQWEQKKNDIIWRGVDTGRGIRLDFVNKFRDTMDVGFSDYVQDALKDPEKYPKELLKGKIPISEILKYKYLPVVDGNDKSSSLGWVMGSNSVPIMPKPRYHSWLCEPWLEAGKHYVEVQRDFSDLPEKIEWCKRNDEKCKQIAENGKLYMIQFFNPLAEEYLEHKLATYATSFHND